MKKKLKKKKNWSLCKRHISKNQCAFSLICMSNLICMRAWQVACSLQSEGVRHP